MRNPSNKESTIRGISGYIVAFMVGLLLAAGVWVAVPYNNFALNNSFVSDGYLPEIVIFCVTFLVLVVNPLLRRFLPSFCFHHQHLALIVSMLLFAAVVPSNGLMRFWPHCVAYDTREINQKPKMAKAIAESELPASLFPDPIGPGNQSPVSDQIMDELLPGQSIPWSAWIAPVVAWGALILACWGMMIGLGGVVFPQWKENERVSFPLLRVYHAIVDEPEKGRAYPPVFRKPLFWAGCGLVFVLHSFNGLAIFTEGQFPTFPVSWDISHAFTDGLWQYAPGFFKSSRIYFLFVGLAYFMPSRYSFSIWFTVLVAGLFVMTSREYMPWFNFVSLYDMGCGGMIVLGGVIVWLGRNHYLSVLRSVFGGAGGDESKISQAFFGRLFLAGSVGIAGWFVWAGAGVGWSLLFLLLIIFVMLLISRIVSETGITYVWMIPLTASRLLDLFPRSWISVSTAFLQEATYIVANRASAVSVTMMMVLSLGMKRDASPRSNRNVAKVGVVVLIVGFLFCGAVHLHMGYSLPSSYDGVQVPVTGRGARLMGLGPVDNLLAGRPNARWGDQLQMTLLGAGVAGILLFLCARFPWWPLHPIGMIFVHSSIGLRLCISLCAGWFLKSVILHYFGAQAYRKAMPFFLGLILGEILANAFWTLVPVLQIWAGASPGEVEHLVIFQYT